MTEDDPKMIKREYVKEGYAGCGRAKVVQTFLKRRIEKRERECAHCRAAKVRTSATWALL